MLVMLVGFAVVTVNGVPTVVGLVTPIDEGPFDGVFRGAAGVVMAAFFSGIALSAWPTIGQHSELLARAQMPVVGALLGALIAMLAREAVELRTRSRNWWWVLKQKSEDLMVLVVLVLPLTVGVFFAFQFITGYVLQESDPNAAVLESLGVAEEQIAQRWLDLAYGTTSQAAAVIALVLSVPAALFGSRVRSSYWSWRRSR